VVARTVPGARTRGSSYAQDADRACRPQERSRCPRHRVAAPQLNCR
jgi:hypothetical protein